MGGGVQDFTAILGRYRRRKQLHQHASCHTWSDSETVRCESICRRKRFLLSTGHQLRLPMPSRNLNGSNSGNRMESNT
ncbi:unnamed protein product [Victoria cruziana]